MGKLSTKDLKKLLSIIKKDSRVIVPPLPGFDSGVHLIDSKHLVVSTDPCIGVPEKWFGWLMIHYVASDVALFGARPEFCTINLLGPLSTRLQAFYNIMKQACSAADELEMAVVTGHTGTYEGLSTLVGVCTGYGVVDQKKLITPGDAKPGDYVILVKRIGLEVVVNLALTNRTLAERLFGVNRSRKLMKLIRSQSCVKEALLLAEMDGVHAMHDATEGGLITALNEMAEASKVGFRIESDRVQIPREVHTLREFFKLSDEQVLSMSSTGTILAAVSPKTRDVIEEALRRNGVEVNVIGLFTIARDRILVKSGKETSFPRKASDPYAQILSRSKNVSQDDFLALGSAVEGTARVSN